MRAFLFCLAVPGAMPAQTVKQLHVEYRNNGGTYIGTVRNDHSAAATAYLGQATFRDKGKQRPTAWGGDSLAHPSGGYALPANSESEGVSALPQGAQPLSFGFMAVIYGDGFSEGDEDVVGMLLAGRHRSYLDLKEIIPLLGEMAAGKINFSALRTRLEAIQQRNLNEALELDQLISVPGMKHRYFINAVPSQALESLRSLDDPELVRSVAAGMVVDYRRWMTALENSKPDIR